MRKKIFWLILVIIMFIPIVIEIINNMNLNSMSYQDFKKLDLGIIYLDSEDSSVKETMFKNIKKFNQKAEIKIKYLNYNSLDKNQKKELEKLIDNIAEGPNFVFRYQGKNIAVRHGAFTEDHLFTLYNKYFSGEQEDIYYNVAGSAEEFITQTQKAEISMAVFGAKSSNDCQLYLPIINDYASKYKIKTYYFDSDTYNQKEFTNVILSGYYIPASSLVLENESGEKLSCTYSGETSVLLNEYQRTPLTLFYKNGEPIDCISGFVDSDSLAKVFKYHKIAKK